MSSGDFSPFKSRADVTPGKMSGIFGLVELSLLSYLLSYVRLLLNTARMSRLSLNFPPFRHVCTLTR